MAWSSTGRKLKAVSTILESIRSTWSVEWHQPVHKSGILLVINNNLFNKITAILICDHTCDTWFISIKFYNNWLDFFHKLSNIFCFCSSWVLGFWVWFCSSGTPLALTSSRLFLIWVLLSFPLDPCDCLESCLDYLCLVWVVSTRLCMPWEFCLDTAARECRDAGSVESLSA